MSIINKKFTGIFVIVMLGIIIFSRLSKKKKKRHALFVTLPGYQGLYFQGVQASSQMQI